jgi:hypothetical protein
MWVLQKNKSWDLKRRKPPRPSPGSYTSATGSNGLPSKSPLEPYPVPHDVWEGGLPSWPGTSLDPHLPSFPPDDTHPLPSPPAYAAHTLSLPPDVGWWVHMLQWWLV